MRSWASHPWTIAVGAGALTVILGEITPVHLLSRTVFPFISKTVDFAKVHVAVPVWLLLILPGVGAVVVLGLKYVLAFARKRTRLIYRDLCWRKLPGHEPEFQPVCVHCGVPMQLRATEEQRVDSNGVPFLFTPQYPNSLLCVGCNRVIQLGRPCGEFLREAQEYFTAIASS